MTTWPTTPDGLLSGAVWNNGGLVAIVSGAAPDPSAAAMFFGFVTAEGLLASGAANLPLVDPMVVNQLWNDNGLLAVSSGRSIVGLGDDGGLLVLTA